MSETAEGACSWLGLGAYRWDRYLLAKNTAGEGNG